MASEPDRPAHNWRSVLDHYDGRCWICGAPWEHKDHYVPLALGGADEPDNWRPAVREVQWRAGQLPGQTPIL